MIVRLAGCFAAHRGFIRSVGIACLVAAAALPNQSRGLTAWTLMINTNNIKLITDYGANATNADNTAFIQSAINAAARGGRTNGLVGGAVRIPGGAGNFLSGPLNLSNNVDLLLDAGAVLQALPYGTYPGSPYSGSVAPLINGTGLTNLAITGDGTIDGQGTAWWTAYGTNSTIARPLLINISGSSRVLVQDINTTNPPVAHIVAKSANAGNLSFIGINLSAPATGAPNTDGIDFAETNALFQDCSIATGDDNIAIGSSASTSKDILITNCFFGPGHGLSIGSYTSGGVSNVTVINCSFNGTGIKIKSSRDRGGIVQNLNYLNLTMTNVDSPVQFYAYYEFGLGTLTQLTPQFVANYCLTNVNPSPYNPPVYRNITVSNLTAALSVNGRNPFLLFGLPDRPASNIVFKSMSIAGTSGVNNPQIYNTTNVSFVDCSWALPSGDKMQFWNADVTFTNSTASTNLPVLDGWSTNGIGNWLDFVNASANLANPVAIASGALLLDRSTLVVSNSLDLSGSAPITFVVGSNPATLIVKGDLQLGGSNNIAAGQGFANGIYTLASCSGALSGSLPTIGLAPTGYNVSLATNSAGQLNLVV
ncbi:MAG TPA: glycosyl hydrolase family 28 protein, partial [Verrucomicrobiae bacterium]